MFQNQFHLLHPKKTISPAIQERLNSLGEEALLHDDVPVGALLLYKGSIIGEGFNTVNRDSNISCHAEINAINEAVKRSDGNFKNLDRDKLVLYSTFEPCEMCKGTILNYNIRNVYFEQKKPLPKQMKMMLKSMYYNFTLGRINAPDLQKNLFLQHPGYKMENRNK